jgi:Transglutaminase-like superfamily
MRKYIIDNYKNDTVISLKNGCHIAFVGHESVVLNVEVDCYVYLDQEHTNEIKQILGKTIDDLEEIGICFNMAKAKCREYIEFSDNKYVSETQSIDRANQEIPGPRIDDMHAINPGSIFSVGAAIIRAKYLLRVRGLKKTIKYVEGLRKSNRIEQRSNIYASDLLEYYKRIRPIFYNPRDNCTLNSLSLLIYLASWQVYPRWYFGVSLRPFEAHCWLEDDQWLYNDHFSRTRRFTPILII